MEHTYQSLVLDLAREENSTSYEVEFLTLEQVEELLGYVPMELLDHRVEDE